MADATPKYELTEMLDNYTGEDLPGNPVWGGARVQYLTENERAEFRLSVSNGLIYDARGGLFDTTDAYNLFTNEGRAIFVMDEHGTFYASKSQKAGEFHHSSLVAGAPVAAAGEIEVSRGQLICISDRSGHYQPGLSFTRQAFDELGKNGIEMSKVTVDSIAIR